MSPSVSSCSSNAGWSGIPGVYVARSMASSPRGRSVTQTVERTQPRVIRMRPEADLERWPDISATELLDGDGIQHGVTLLDEPVHGLSAGLWTYTAQTSTWMIQPSHEFMTWDGTGYLKKIHCLFRPS